MHAITSYTKVNALGEELKTVSVKELHWKKLMKRLDVSWVLPKLTIDQIWEALQKNEVLIRDALQVARGEMAFEELSALYNKCPPNRTTENSLLATYLVTHSYNEANTSSSAHSTINRSLQEHKKP